MIHVPPYIEDEVAQSQHWLAEQKQAQLLAQVKIVTAGIHDNVCRACGYVRCSCTGATEAPAVRDFVNDIRRYENICRWTLDDVPYLRDVPDKPAEPEQWAADVYPCGPWEIDSADDLPVRWRLAGVPSVWITKMGPGHYSWAVDTTNSVLKIDPRDHHGTADTIEDAKAAADVRLRPEGRRDLARVPHIAEYAGYKWRKHEPGLWTLYAPSGSGVGTIARGEDGKYGCSYDHYDGRYSSLRDAAYCVLSLQTCLYPELEQLLRLLLEAEGL